MSEATELSLWPSRRDSLLALALAALLYLCYLLSFTGMPQSNDELFIYDTVSSLALGPDLWMNETSYLRPVQASDVEPGQPLAAVPLFWLAYHVPWLGNLHTALQLNPIVTALTGALLYLFAMQWGYSRRTALITALLFGLTTIAWPYTQNFFREPLSTLTALLTAFGLDRWRRLQQENTTRWSWLWLLIGLASAFYSLLTKETALVMLPFLVILIIPADVTWRTFRPRRLAIFIGAAALLALGLFLMIWLRDSLIIMAGRYDLAGRLQGFWRGLSLAHLGIAGYLLSPSKAIWVYSPVTVLALAGPFMLPRARWREGWLLLGMTLLFVLVYAAVRAEIWQGGASWGPRYMTPLTPFLMLAALPAIDRALKASSRWGRIGLGLLAALGAVIQAGALYVFMEDYYAYQIASTGFYPWQGPMVWSLRWSQAIGTLLYAPQAETELAWIVLGPDWLALLVILSGIGLAAVLLGQISLRETPGRLWQWLALGSPLLALALALFALWRAYPDPRYLGDSQELAQLRADLGTLAAPNDRVLLNATTYTRHFMNYYKGRATWFNLPDAPGERYSYEQAPAVISGAPRELLGEDGVGGVHSVMEGSWHYRGGDIWLVMNNSVYLPWSVRPAEWYLSEAAYPLEQRDYSPTLRLLHYLPYPAPTSPSPGSPLERSFGEQLYLQGYDLHHSGPQPGAEGLTLRARDHLALSLVWMAPQRISADYTISVRMAASDGFVIQQQDRAPVGGFRPTSGWQPGEVIRDNHGFVVPEGLPPGDYVIQIVVYNWISGERLAVSPVEAAGPDVATLLHFTVVP